jgi:hypothetical protein
MNVPVDKAPRTKVPKNRGLPTFKFHRELDYTVLKALLLNETHLRVDRPSHMEVVSSS